MAEEKSLKRSMKEQKNTEDESEDEMIGPLPVQASKPKKKKGSIFLKSFIVFDLVSVISKYGVNSGPTIH